MEKPGLLSLGAIVMVQVFGIISGCFLQEKAALLDFKATYFNDSVLPSWVDDPKSNCCSWERVACDSTSVHVIHLTLDQVQPVPWWSCGNHTITSFNWSVFQPFKELRTLNLSDNCIDGFIWKGGTISC